MHRNKPNTKRGNKRRNLVENVWRVNQRTCRSGALAEGMCRSTPLRCRTGQNRGQQTPGVRSAALLYDPISAGRQILKDRLSDMCALVRRDPFVVEVRTAIALGIFDKGAMNCVRNQRFDSLF